MSWTRFRPLLVSAVGLALAVSLPGVARADRNDDAASRDKKAFFDVRQTPQSVEVLRGRAAKLDSQPSPAIAALKAGLGAEGVAAIDPLTSTPRMLGRLDGFLTGPSGASAQSIALGYVQRNRDAFGLDAAAFGSLSLARDYVSIDGTHHLSFVQAIGGVTVFGNGLKANVAADGSLVNVSGSPLVDLSGAAAAPSVSADEALDRKSVV